MAGCTCPTCEGQRAYQRRPEVLARHAANERRRMARLDEIAHARVLAQKRGQKRRAAERRDQQLSDALQGGHL